MEVTKNGRTYVFKINEKVFTIDSQAIGNGGLQKKMASLFSNQAISISEMQEILSYDLSTVPSDTPSNNTARESMVVESIYANNPALRNAEMWTNLASGQTMWLNSETHENIIEVKELSTFHQTFINVKKLNQKGFKLEFRPTKLERIWMDRDIWRYNGAYPNSFIEVYNDVPDTLPDKFLDLLDRLFRGQSYNVLAWINEAFNRRHLSIFYLRGSRGMGKSSFIKVLTALFNSASVTRIPDRRENTFNGEWEDKKLIIFDDNKWILRKEQFEQRKRFSNDTFSLEAKNKNARDANTTFSVILASNPSENLYVLADERNIFYPDMYNANLTTPEWDFFDNIHSNGIDLDQQKFMASLHKHFSLDLPKYRNVDLEYAYGEMFIRDVLDNIINVEQSKKQAKEAYIKKLIAVKEGGLEVKEANALSKSLLKLKIGKTEAPLILVDSGKYILNTKMEIDYDL